MTIQFRRGPAAHLPTLADGEPAWTTDTHVLYVGQGGTNYSIGGSGTVTSVATSGSLTGGPITTSGTLHLVNDNATPGNSYYYGTDSGGTKGFFPLPGGSSLSSPLTTKGDIWCYSTTDDRLPAGSDGQILYADSTQATGLRWGTAPSGSSPLTTKGDLYIFSIADARLPVGSDGQLLIANSGDSNGLTWTSLSGDASISTSGAITVSTAGGNTILVNGSSASGDLSGSYPGPTVAALQGRAVSSSAPSNGDVLTWNAGSSDWEPAPAASGSLSIGEAVTSGTANSVLFIDGSGNLGQNTNFTYNTATLFIPSLNVGPSSNCQIDSAGNGSFNGIYINGNPYIVDSSGNITAVGTIHYNASTGGTPPADIASALNAIWTALNGLSAPPW